MLPRGHRTPIEHEIDLEEETTEAKIRTAANSMVTRTGGPGPDGRKIYPTGGLFSERVWQTFRGGVFDALQGAGRRGCSNNVVRSDRALSYEEQSNATKEQSKGGLYKPKLRFRGFFAHCFREKLIDTRNYML